MQIVDGLWSDLLCRDEAPGKLARGNYTASRSSRRARDEDGDSGMAPRTETSSIAGWQRWAVVVYPRREGRSDRRNVDEGIGGRGQTTALGLRQCNWGDGMGKLLRNSSS